MHSYFRVDPKYVLESNPYTTEHIFSSNSGSRYTLDLSWLYLDRDHSSTVGHVFSSFQDVFDSHGFFLLSKTRKDIWKGNIKKRKGKGMHLHSTPSICQVIFSTPHDLLLGSLIVGCKEVQDL